MAVNRILNGRGWQLSSTFILLGILFIPFPFNLTRFQFSVTETLFGKLVSWTAASLFNIKNEKTDFHSDSVSLYILVAWLMILSIIILVISRRWISQSLKEKISRVIYQLACYYLALQLLKYGVDKIFNNQFYLPEPNTLYTPFGKMDRDILYWSSMGTSKFYSVFLGVLEASAAIMLMIKRTRLPALLLSFGILLNVVAVNFGFDITVKLFSLFLLFINLYLLAPYFRPLVLFILQRPHTYEKFLKAPGKQPFYSSFLHWLITGMIVLEVCYPFTSDRTARPFLHGVYEVNLVMDAVDTMALANSPVKRFFIHRKGYLIFQDQQDHMTDYKMSYKEGENAFYLTDYNLKRQKFPFVYNEQDSTISLDYSTNGKILRLRGKMIDWRTLPALRRGFHWISE